MKMHITNTQGVDNLLRLLLLSTLVFYIPWPGFFSAVKGETLEIIQLQAENGMGGGMLPENVVQADPGLGVPEPEEYSRPQVLTFDSYTLEKGDIIGNIAMRAGLSEDTLISVNNVKNARLMQIGQVIRIPNQDGIYYTVKADESLESIAEKYKTTVPHIKQANELFSTMLASNTNIFIPGARMDWVDKQEINGDLFIWPCSGYITSMYGYRIAPFAGTRQFHSGVDLGAPMGSPVKAAMSGRVSQTGYDNSFGNFILLTHHSGYRTFYAHLSLIRVKPGAYVDTGERIGDIGSTGLSTGPHLHFTVYKNGVTVNPISLIK